VCIFIS